MAAQTTIDDIPVDVSQWDQALVEQAVLHFGHGGWWFSANTFRHYLPDLPPGHVGKAIRALARKGVIVQARDGNGYPVTVRSTSGPTHGKEIRVYVLAKHSAREGVR